MSDARVVRVTDKKYTTWIRLTELSGHRVLDPSDADTHPPRGEGEATFCRW